MFRWNGVETIIITYTKHTVQKHIAFNKKAF